ncbi:hypothetical protein ACGFNU_20935 [Spirillospora sp. NPDC048911]|uniref:hypothetical protein n=1 Tax=Spirillospora sp. NPDC048911 TaxID=3364527 RepID=UPI00370FBAF7
MTKFKPAVPTWAIGAGFTSLLSAAMAVFATGRLILAATNLVVLGLFIVVVVASIDMYAPKEQR